MSGRSRYHVLLLWDGGGAEVRAFLGRGVAVTLYCINSVFVLFCQYS